MHPGAYDTDRQHGHSDLSAQRVAPIRSACLSAGWSQSVHQKVQEPVPIAGTLPLDDWRTAVEISLSGQARGKLLLLP